MFTDKRSKKIIFVAHCVLNQNAKLDRCAYYPGAVQEVSRAIVESGIGIVQLPCPELLHLGLDRQAANGKITSVAEEDTRIARCMTSAGGLAFCRELANQLVSQVEEYKKHGFSVVGLVGINGSPTCGVETTWYEGQEQAGPGVFIRLVQEALDQKYLAVSMRGIKAYETDKAMMAVMELLGR